MDTRERLAEARKGLHELLLGVSVRVAVDQNGERLEFVPTDVPRLRAYVAELERELTSPGPSGRGDGPMYLMIG